MTPAYTYLARAYDFYMEDVDYEQWVDYLLYLFALHNHEPSKILDLGCGTGNITIPLAERGFALTGVDLSLEMVAEARRKAIAKGLDVPILNQNLLALELGGKRFDTVLSVCDVLNYLIEDAKLKLAFEQVYQHLQPGGFWFFDLNSAHKLQNIYGDQFYADLQTDFAYFWDNSYDHDEEICTMDLTFFIETDDGVYKRVRETHQQKLWLPGQIEALAEKTGFSFLACYNFLETSAWNDSTERWQFVLCKKG